MIPRLDQQQCSDACYIFYSFQTNRHQHVSPTLDSYTAQLVIKQEDSFCHLEPICWGLITRIVSISKCTLNNHSRQIIEWIIHETILGDSTIILQSCKYYSYLLQILYSQTLITLILYLMVKENLLCLIKDTILSHITAMLSQIQQYHSQYPILQLWLYSH